MIYFHIAVMVISVLVCYKWGDWRHWNKYYSTIQFFIIGDYIYNILFHDTWLWRYVSTILNHTLIDILMGIFMIPSTVMIFIPYYPKGILKQIEWVFLWVFIYSSIEFISWSLGFFAYNNGWNTLWSIALNIVLFPLLYVHYKKPLLAWLIAIIELVTYIIIFKVDILN